MLVYERADEMARAVRNASVPFVPTAGSYSYTAYIYTSNCFIDKVTGALFAVKVTADSR
jgi:hypothetical protein